MLRVSLSCGLYLRTDTRPGPSMTGQSLSDLVGMGVDVAEPGPAAVAPESIRISRLLAIGYKRRLENHSRRTSVAVFCELWPSCFAHSRESRPSWVAPATVPLMNNVARIVAAKNRTKLQGFQSDAESRRPLSMIGALRSRSIASLRMTTVRITAVRMAAARMTGSLAKCT